MKLAAGSTYQYPQTIVCQRSALQSQPVLFNHLQGGSPIMKGVCHCGLK